MAPEPIMHPINAFPEDIQHIINHYADIKGYPHEYFITAFLGASSTAIGRAVTLSTGNFTAIGLIWAAIIGKPGMTKSEAQTDAFKPIKSIQFHYINDYDRQVAEQEATVRNEKDKVEIPQPPKFLLSDITPEALSMTLAANPKGCGIVYDELAGFVGRFNRYNAGADEQMFLSLFNGDTILRTRVNANGNAAIKNSFLTIIGTIQPGILKDVFSGKSESGFFDRWLMCFPENLKKPYPNVSSLDPIVEAKYHGIVSNMLRLTHDQNEPYVIYYSPDAYQIVNEYQRSLIDKQNETEKDTERSIMAKMEIYLHRFALLLQVIDYALPGNFNNVEYSMEVKPAAAKGAVILSKYFLSEAMKLRLTSPIENLKDQWINIYEALPGHGQTFDRGKFLAVCNDMGIKQRRADTFLKENSDRTDAKIFFKVSHGLYTKNLF